MYTVLLSEISSQDGISCSYWLIWLLCGEPLDSVHLHKLTFFFGAVTCKVLNNSKCIIHSMTGHSDHIVFFVLGHCLLQSSCSHTSVTVP